MDKGLLNEATSPDDSPTPGYMLGEIARLTVANYQACLQLIEFLNARLRKNNHNVKYKCLMIIKHVCRNGRADFKKEMGRNLDPVKECLQYKGPPDPLRGDEIYRRVRDAAKEALDAIFDSQMPLTTSAVSNRIQGIGGGEEGRPAAAATPAASNSSGFSFSSFRSDNDGGSYVGASEGDTSGVRRMSGFSNTVPTSAAADYHPNTSASTSTTGMTGIGNPNFKDPRAEVSLMQKMAALAEGALGSNPSTAAPISSQSSSDYQMRSNRDSPFGTTHKTPGYLPSMSGPWSSNHSTSPPVSSPLQMSGGIVPDIPSISGGLGRAGSAASDGVYEQNLVAALCEPGGMKAVPPEDKLEGFLSAASTLSPELIGSNLIGFINSDAWQSRAKALVVISSLVKRPGCSLHHNWWVANGVEDIQILAQTDTKATVKTQAIRSLRTLGVSVTASTPSASHPPTAVATPPGNSSLLVFDGDEHSLNSNLQVAAPHQAYLAAPPAPTDSLMNFLEQQTPAPAPESIVASSGADDGLFFGMSVPSSQAPSNQPASFPPTPPQPQPTSLFDFIDTSPQPPSQPAPAPQLDLNALYGPPQPVVPPPQPNASLSPLAGLNLSVPVRMPPQSHPQGYPSQSYASRPQYPPQQYAPQYPPQYPQPYPPQYPPQQTQYTPMVPSAMGMNNPQLGVRKVIPDSTSGFSFLGESVQNKNSDDAFSFVKDVMQKK